MMEAEPYLIDDDKVPTVSVNSSSINESEGTSSLILSATRARDHATMSNGRVMKNVFVMSSSLFLFFLAYQSLQNLQSTMNADDGIGLKSQAVINAASMVSSVFLPDLLIKTYGAKRTAIFMIIISLPYLASNYNPRYDIIMPSSVLIGIAIGPFNAATAYYIYEMAARFSKMSKSETLQMVLARFCGIMSFSLENTQIWGNLASYFVLRPGMAPILNHTDNFTCGIYYPSESTANPNLQPPSDDKRIMLVSIYLTSAVVAAVLMGLFMDKLDNDVEVNGGERKCKFIVNRLVASLKQAVLVDQMLLVPISIFIGMEIAFYTGDFTEAFIACSWGVHHVGFVTMCFGVCGALMSLVVGPLVKSMSQMAVLVLAGCCCVTLYVLLFFWRPSPEQLPQYFVLAGVWGMCDAVWWSQIIALYGLMFPKNKEAAFSNFYFWTYFGAFLSYSYSHYFSVPVKIGILSAFVILGVLGYLIGQARIKYSQRTPQYAIVVEEE